MRLRYAVALCLTTLLSLLFLARHHLRDLSEVARTYSTFYDLLQTHPDILYRYPQSNDSPQPSERSSEAVPKIIHQIFLTEGRNSTLSKYSSAVATCRQIHPEWTHNLWTDDNATAFMREHYPEIAPHYEGYKQSIQRANILRYALLDHYGGVYLDLDVTCLVPLDDLRHLPWLTPGAYPAGVNNAFILSKPHHGFLTELLGKVPSRDMSWPMPYVENMLSTGCMYFSNRWMSYARYLFGSPGGAAEADKIYILADEEGNMDPHMLRGKVTTPLFAHGGASSWHGWDAAAIVMIGKHYVYFALIAGISAVCTIALVWKLVSLASRRKLRSPKLGARRSLEKRDDDVESLLPSRKPGRVQSW